ncbi:MAG: hypothetical protein HC895_12725 [Leptolyngbyaceae cyanobacterium SM1_3_5]|nr:hypothetical protein [Leptolyngbyaceae cyanobacterium SM1_3_5]
MLRTWLQAVGSEDGMDVNMMTIERTVSAFPLAMQGVSVFPAAWRSLKVGCFLSPSSVAFMQSELTHCNRKTVVEFSGLHTWSS